MADASFLVRLWLWLYIKVNGLNKLNGWASFWHTIYVAPEKLQDFKVIAHECQHIKQIDDLGIIKFSFLYVKETIKNGYRNNRFEVEARAARLSNFLGIYKIEGYL